MKRPFIPDSSWTLFLDRDGVINQRPENDYVKSPADFHWTEGALESLIYFSRVFTHILVVTNQQGIGKGLMSEKDLELIHKHMTGELTAAGGRIDKVYFCADLKGSGSFYRKPNVGMALKAKKDFPGIDFASSIMVGDTLSDMRFGKRLKMKTVLVDAGLCTARLNHRLIDLRFSSLAGFADHLRSLGINP